MTASHHGRRPVVKAAQALGGIVAFVALAEAAHVVSVLAGPAGLAAGAALTTAVFAACWAAHHVRQLLHPARDCEPATPAESRPPARIAA
jgi:hypothetical protein